MLEGLLVDLVPYGKKFWERDHEWWNNESRFWSGGGQRQFVSKAQVEREHKEWIEADTPESGVPFGAQTKDGKPLGYFGINWISYHNRFGVFGASIGESEYWGGGYGTDALLLLTDFAFNELDLRRVCLDTMSFNARVIRQMEKVGWTLEARRRHDVYADGVWHDELAYGLLREEWPGRAVMIERLGLKTR